ncbi:tRNA (N(6)-L-threonylcarbamoyladenosine(37)-C(2))-methylthiotransferase MtaB [Sinanaerobacter sp. ZZT-01]|uniref:tRNA (N(6)-L-threonylcarbamoyladenosine(37)-C(2))- methylthiotransferase MtaB n=1 Tax=Sinanaerobacter sp. ZZT-01 TaxID=3111540 RepID=UPI002D7702E9|nr:tRNA (N(6)-L-threonylcarbamoyladenosine(37)-C(2))-methylthiotransferase MtaB [Sinanaerobacter sp. ZZT-01]WRR92877.1 tRNA (N(6)-L-threonylcarbamoyladenosine(37)-C(2))-methylthiotransferase MtaB [Sinanaerobacter sp. ZZT-01]
MSENKERTNEIEINDAWSDMAKDFASKHGRRILIGIKTLGCKVNQYETQALKEKFTDLGYEIVEDTEFADVYVINTCTVTGLADRKSRQYIRRVKRINPHCITAVIGCYAQVNPEEVGAISGVDIVAGTNEKNKLPLYVEEAMEQKSTAPIYHVKDYHDLCEYDETGSITSMESRTRAFIKIQEGCNRFCSYCVIPYARGAVRSRTKEEILAEAQSLLNQGFKELVLTGINTALYGSEPGFVSEEEFVTDHEGCKRKLYGVEIVIKALNELPGHFRIRLSSLEPTVVNAEYVKHLLNYKKLCHHFHLSIQSGSNEVLNKMNRNYSREDYYKMVEELRKTDPGFGFSTDIIVGFPGETERDFRDSADMVEKVHFCKVHVFKYSKRPMTKAAQMKGHLPPEVKSKRSEELIRIAESTAREFYTSLSGSRRMVLFEEYNPETGYYRGHSDNFIEVFCKSEQDISDSFAWVSLERPYRSGMLGILEQDSVLNPVDFF